MEKTLQSNRHRALIDMLIEQRRNVGMTQQQLADAINQFQSYVARLESGQRRVDVVEFIHLCTLLDLNPNDVITKLQDIPE